jgi:3D (Asp-Asp-Asp) domain-containing protein
MQPKRRHRQIKRLQKKYQHIAAAMAGAALLSSNALPGIPAAAAHAASPDSTTAPPVATTQQINAKDATSPLDPSLKDKPVQTPEMINNTSQKNPNIDTVVQKNIPDNYQQVLNIKATAYAPGAHDNDQWGNKTFIGTQIRPGIIAVDPRVIPLGSRVYILFPDGHGEYAVAEDTGGAIKGNRIDIAKWTVSEAEDFGIQHVKVFVLNTPHSDLVAKK